MDKNLSELFDLFNKKKFSVAKIKCENLLKKIDPNFEIFNLYAVILYELEEYDEAIINWKKSIKLNPNYFHGYNNLGNVYLKKNELNFAIEFYDKAIEIKNDYYEAYHNKGNVNLKLGKLDKALDNYNLAIKIKSDYIPSIKSKCEIFIEQKKLKEALTELEKLFILEPFNTENIIKSAHIYFDLNNFDKALEKYKEAFEINSNVPFLLGNLIHTKTKICDWNNLDDYQSKLLSELKNNSKVCPPYIATTIYDLPDIQFKCAKIWQKEFNREKTKSKFNNSKKKIKLGFYSSDFRTHAIGHLITRMLELHDKNKFELHGFYFGPDLDKSDIIQNRIIKSFNSFNNVRHLSDIEIKNLSRTKEIDIAIDCMGHTGNENRFGIFIERLAPIQINYLGYPGTSGSKFIDYIVADKMLIPQEYQKYYSEKIIYLPDTYQPNEEDKDIYENFTKDTFALPRNKFIFSCFNSHQKITKKMFEVWIDILQKKQDSILWLLKDNDFSEINLKKFSLEKGIEPDRIIFADRLPLNKHLGRLKFADLFLDTYPYNAHTTCSDALRVNVPVLTLKGKSFASRVAASLNNSIGMKELNLNTLEEYKTLAIKIANEDDYLKKLKLRIKENKINSKLFQIIEYTKNIEKAYEIIYQKFINNEQPDNISL